MAADRELDVVVHGATGFVGRLTAEYLAEHAPHRARIGLGGRSRERLAEVRDALGPRAARWPLHVADSSDPAALRRLAESTRVVVSTVGPYRAHGMPLVEACARTGTHYADLTGEILFMRATIDAYHDLAAASGARIVHSCGFDSIPSDLGVLLLNEAAKADGDGELEQTTFVVRSMKGSFSGGTLASIKGQLDELRGDPALRRIATDPYALSPDRAAEPDLGRERDLMRIEHDAELGWLAPFVMASVNTRAVRRSNALQGWAYGRRLRYREVVGAGRGRLAPVVAGAVATGTGALAAGLLFPPTRFVLDRLLPSPGEGPDEDARRSGRFAIDLHTQTAGGRSYRGRVAATGDPGYAATAVMLGESALCLALDEARLPPYAGVLTPATGMGLALVERLRAAGQTFEAGPA